MGKHQYISIFILFQLIVSLAFSAEKGISFYTRIKKPDLTNLNATGVSVNAKLLTPNGCVLRDENFSSITINEGLMNLTIGQGTLVSQVSGKNLKDLMSNSSPLSGLTCLDASNNPTGTTVYTPVSSDTRKLRLSFSADSQNFIVDFPIRAVTQAFSAENAESAESAQKLGTKTASDFVQTNGSTTQISVDAWFGSSMMSQILGGTYNAPTATSATTATTAGNVSGVVAIANGGTGASTAAAARTNLGLGTMATMTPTGTPDGTKFLKDDGSWGAVSGGSGGTVTSITAGTGLNVGAGPGGNITSSGTLNVDVGTSANQIVQLNGTGKLPAVDGSQLTNLVASQIPNLDASKITTGTITNNVSSSLGQFSQLKIYDGASKYLTMSVPIPLTNNYGIKFPSDVGTTGQVLEISSVAAGVATLGWVTPGGSIPTANGSTTGLLSAADWTTFNNKLSSINSSDVTTALGFTPANSTSLSGYVAKTGDTMSGLLTLSANPSAALDAATKQYVDSAVAGATPSQWTTSGSDIYFNSGSVSIGTTTPNAKLTVSGAATSRSNIITTGATVDLSLSNNHFLKSPGGSAITLQNLADGGVYTLIVNDTTSRTYTFSGCTNSYFSPANGSTTFRSTYTILVIVDTGVTNCFINWATGFN